MSTESFHGTSYSIGRLWKPAQPHCWGLEVMNNPGNPQSDGTKAEWKTQWRLPLDQELLAAQMIYRCDVISSERINDGNYIRIQDLDVPWFVNIYPHLVWEWLRCAGIILPMDKPRLRCVDRKIVVLSVKLGQGVMSYHYVSLERCLISWVGTTTDPRFRNILIGKHGSYREATMLSLHFTKSTEVKATGQPGQPGQRGQRANARTSWDKWWTQWTSMDTTTHLTLDASGRLGQGGIAFATAFVARASAGNLWLRMASMLRCFIDASSLHAASGFIWFPSFQLGVRSCSVLPRGRGTALCVQKRKETVLHSDEWPQCTQCFQ